jgi:ribokinase
LLLENLKTAGVHIDYVHTELGIASGTALVMIGNAGENYLSVAPGANYRLTPAMIAELEPLLREAGILVLQYEVPPETLYACIDLGHKLGLPVLFNLAPARPFDERYLPKITYLVVNETEAQSLCGFAVNNPERVEQAAATLLSKGAGTVILTLGEQGAYLATPNLRQAIPAFKVEAVDTTAAGDVFCGALAVYLVEGKTLSEAARFASAASAICVTRLGAQPSAPQRLEIEQLAGTA